MFRRGGLIGCCGMRKIIPCEECFPDALQHLSFFSVGMPVGSCQSVGEEQADFTGFHVDSIAVGMKKIRERLKGIFGTHDILFGAVEAEERVPCIIRAIWIGQGFPMHEPAAYQFQQFVPLCTGDDAVGIGHCVEQLSEGCVEISSEVRISMDRHDVKQMNLWRVTYDGGQYSALTVTM